MPRRSPRKTKGIPPTYHSSNFKDFFM
jgi:hypothetical protein